MNKSTRKTKSDPAILRDALRYRYLREAKNQDHRHHTRAVLQVEQVGWPEDLGAVGYCWSSVTLNGKRLDELVDRYMKVQNES
jgi:hypothetical protein